MATMARVACGRALQQRPRRQRRGRYVSAPRAVAEKLPVTDVPHPAAGLKAHDAGLDACGDEARDIAREMAEWMCERTTIRPEVAIICGSGLGVLADDVEDAVHVPYEEVPHLPITSVVGHAGNLVFGNLEGRPVVLMQGRTHIYEGFTAEEATRGIRAFKEMGVHTLVLTNAVGSINPEYEVGDVVQVLDHISFAAIGGGMSPCRGVNTHGSRFVEMARVYDPDLVRAAQKVAGEAGIPLRAGVFAYTMGPSFETPAEVRALRTLGADTVGMSVAPEATIALHNGMRVFGLSVVSNVCFDQTLEEEPGDADALHLEVLRNVKEIGIPRAREILRRMTPTLATLG
mmetsp:Transcript_23050/g.78527  ORF Transcript_23050/g.78527 Transcript_23050/m.78527 type:complete len:345 (+) Transcript_23050:122-1156(+)